MAAFVEPIRPHHEKHIKQVSGPPAGIPPLSVLRNTSFLFSAMSAMFSLGGGGQRCPVMFSLKELFSVRRKGVLMRMNAVCNI